MFLFESKDWKFIHIDLSYICWNPFGLSKQTTYFVPSARNSQRAIIGWMTCGCWIINLIDYYVDKRIILCIFRWKTRVVAISVSLIDGTHFLFRRDVNSINIQIFNNSTSKIFFCKFPWRFFYSLGNLQRLFYILHFRLVANTGRQISIAVLQKNCFVHIFKF